MDILSFLIEKKLTALLIFTIISVAIAIAVTLYEKRPKPKREEQKESYPLKLDYLLLNRTPDDQLAAITFLFRDFLNKEFGTDPKLELDIIEKNFENNPSIAKFCRDLTAAYYSKEKIDDRLIKDLSLSLKEVFFEREPNIRITEMPKKNIKFNKYTSTINPPKPLPQKMPYLPQAKAPANLRHGVDHQNNLSVFTHHHHAANAKQNVHEAKHSLKKINNSAKSGKEGTLNENLAITEWAESISKLKNEIIDDYKKVISKI